MQCSASFKIKTRQFATLKTDSSQGRTLGPTLEKIFVVAPEKTKFGHCCPVLPSPAPKTVTKPTSIRSITKITEQKKKKRKIN